MRYAISCAFGLALCLFGVSSVKGQGCVVDMQAHYSVYATETTDDVNVYTTVLTDGYANFTPSAGCSGQGVTHQPRSYNLLYTKGGWGYGTAGCITCYASYQNNQQVAEDADGGGGDDPVFVWQGEIFCSLAGNFFSQSGGPSPNECDFTISPAGVHGVPCNNGEESHTNFTATIKPSVSQCSYNSTSSSCSWKRESGTIDADANSPTDSNLGFEACTANYFAGPGTSGELTGTVEWSMTLVLKGAKITHHQIGDIYCN